MIRISIAIRRNPGVSSSSLPVNTSRDAPSSASYSVMPSGCFSIAAAIRSSRSSVIAATTDSLFGK